MPTTVAKGKRPYRGASASARTGGPAEVGGGLQVLGYVGIQLGVVFLQEFAQTVDIAAEGLVRAAADGVEATQLAIGAAALQ